MTKIEKVRRQVRESLFTEFGKYAKDKFGLDVEHEYDLFAMQNVSRRKDRKLFTRTQKAALAHFESGYLAAMKHVREV